VHDRFQAGALLAESLCAIGLVPDVGLFEFALDLGQAFGLVVVVKDTSSALRCAR